MRPLSLLSFVILLGGSFLYCFSSTILPASGVSSSSPWLLSSTAVNTTNATTNTNVTLDEVPVLNSKGIALNSLGKYNESIVYFDKGLAIDPKNVLALNEKGNAFGGLGNYKQAIANYDKALAVDPKNATVLDNKGVAFYHLGNYTGAITYYDRALAIDPS
ncbi:MAG: tetratricopeptide repeat protein, partial [Nitrososphaeraceae archaeon]